MRKKLLYIILFSALTFSGFGQVNSFSDQYLANLFLLNPAIAGSARYAVLSASSRQQWVGWDGAPSSQSVTFHTRWAKSKERFTPFGFVNKGKNTYSNVGVGGGFFHDAYGVFHVTGIHLDYAYHVFLSRDRRLSLGLAPSFFQIGTSSIIFADPNDPYLANPNKSYFIDFNAGAHYSDKNAYAGISLIQLFNSSVRFGHYGFPGNEDPSLNPDLARSVYAYGGYFFMLNRDINLKIEPMALVKLNASSGLRFDVSAAVHLRDQFQAGVSYRWKEGFLAFTGVRLDNLAFRYILEIPVTSDVPSRFTTHMIQLSMNIGQPID